MEKNNIDIKPHLLRKLETKRIRLPRESSKTVHMDTLDKSSTRNLTLTANCINAEVGTDAVLYTVKIEVANISDHIEFT